MADCGGKADARDQLVATDPPGAPEAALPKSTRRAEGATWPPGAPCTDTTGRGWSASGVTTDSHESVTVERPSVVFTVSRIV